MDFVSLCYSWFLVENIAQVQRQDPHQRSSAPFTESEERREQLIKATIRCGRTRTGCRSTTHGRPSAREAGLSQGIINLHFQSKDQAAAWKPSRYVVDEYKTRAGSASHRRRPGESAAERLAAMVDAGFPRRCVCKREQARRCGSRSGVKSKARPTYRKLCARAGSRVRPTLMKRFCSEEIVEAGAYVGIEPNARGHWALAAITEGLWLDMLINRPGASSRLDRPAP